MKNRPVRFLISPIRTLLFPSTRNARTPVKFQTHGTNATPAGRPRKSTANADTATDTADSNGRGPEEKCPGVSRSKRPVSRSDRDTSNSVAAMDTDDFSQVSRLSRSKKHKEVNDEEKIKEKTENGRAGMGVFLHDSCIRRFMLRSAETI